MKGLFITSLLVLTCIIRSYSQDSLELLYPIKHTDTFNCFFDLAPYPLYDLSAYQAKHLQYPKELENEAIEGKLILQFLVKSDGSITNVKVLKSLHPKLDSLAVKMAETMPKWAPGRKSGKIADHNFILPIKICLE